MSGNGSNGKELFSRMVKAGQKTYFINVKKAKNGNNYLAITESRRVEKDQFDKSRVMVFRDKLEEFIEAIRDAGQVVG